MRIILVARNICLYGDKHTSRTELSVALLRNVLPAAYSSFIVGVESTKALWQ